MDPNKAIPGIKNRESLIRKGEGSKIGGFMAVTPNGTSTWRGTGWNWFPPTSEPPVAPKKVWPRGRNNRTGE